MLIIDPKLAMGTKGSQTHIRLEGASYEETIFVIYRPVFDGPIIIKL